MKKEATAKNKKWLWLVIALVAILAVAGVLVAVLLGGGNPDEGGATPTSKLYWNVDKVAFTENPEAVETGLTTRERDDDGLYHVRLATGGELIEVLVDDARLINYIDTLDALGLVFDADGMVVDAIDPSVFNPEIVRDFYVRRVTDTSVTVNSSIAMNGMEMTFDLTNIGVYDVSDTAAQPGMPAVCDVMDTIFVYGDMDGNATDVFVVERAQSAEVYWALSGYYDSTTKETTRIPDKNGVYTMTFAYKGELVDLKCKDKLLVNELDKTGSTGVDRSYALLFDEEGYIIGSITTEMAVRGMLAADRYHIDSLENGTFHAVGYTGNTAGMELTTTLRDDCEVYLVCDNGTVRSHIGEKTELQMGDRVLVFTDLEGNAKLIYVLNRLVDSPLYYNLDRNYNSGKQATNRTPDENGYYNIRMFVNGKIKNYRTKDVDLVTAIDTPEHRGVGLKLRGDIIEKVYDIESVTSMPLPGWGRYITGMTGTIISAANIANINNPINLVVPPECKIYNVTGDKDGTALGSITELRMYDQVSLFQDVNGLCAIYVTKRYVPDAKIYYNIEAKWDKTTKETTRTPDEDGYYVINMACEGKQVEVKTKSKEIASYIDTRNPKYVALKVNKSGVIKGAYDVTSVVKGGYLTSSSYYYDGFKDGLYNTYWTSDGEKFPGTTRIVKGSKAPGVYNVSNAYDVFKGEKTTMRKDDKLVFLISRVENYEAHTCFITERKLDIDMAYNKTRMYNTTTKETTRTPDADGYYVYELAINGEVKQYKTKDKAVATKLDSFSNAFGVKLKGDIIEGVYTSTAVKGVTGTAVGRFDVTTIDGNKVTFTRNRPTSTNLGEVLEKVIAKDCKVYDMSPYAEKWGGKVKLGLGDRVEAYANDAGELCYINIIYACTREEGPVSKCDHCDKEVWWEPYVGETFAVNDIHYYFPTETTMSKQFNIGSGIKPAVEFAAKGTINAYKGVSFVGAVEVNEGNFNELDESPIAQAANAMTFPKDGSDYVAKCPACDKEVTWKAINGERIMSANGSHFYIVEDAEFTHNNPVVYSNPVEREQGTLCLHLNGTNITTTSRIEAQKGIMNIMGQGTVTSDCTSQDYGSAVISIQHSSATVNLYGGKYVADATLIEASYVLDLNGQKITSTKKIAQVYGDLDIYDTVGGGVIGTANTTSNQLGGSIVVASGGVVNLHSGTLNMDAAGADANTGGVVLVNNDGVFNMLGGAITGGRAGSGGNVAVAGGTFNMKAGTISGGTATSNGANIYIKNDGIVNITGGKIIDGSAKNGGNAAVLNGTFNLSGGTISGGQASNQGGNVYVLDAGCFNMTGGKVSDGQAVKDGGNFLVQASNGTLDADGNQVFANVKVSGGTVSNGTAGAIGGNFALMPYGKLDQTGGKIVGGTAATSGSSIALGSVNARLNLGGTVTGGEVYINKNGTTTISGKAVIDTLLIDPTLKVSLGELKDGANIKVEADGAFTNANENADDYAKYFTAVGAGADSGKVVYAKDNVLYYALPPVLRVCPVCGGEPVEWIAVSGPTQMAAGNHYFLADEVNYDFNTSDSNNALLSGAGCFDLNGKNVTVNAGSFFTGTTAGTVNIMDTVGGSVVTGSNNRYGNNGLAVMVNADGLVVNLYGGTYKGMQDTITNPAITDADNVSAIIRVRIGTLKMYDGVTVDGETDGNFSLGSYPTLYVGHTTDSQAFYMYGGVIKNGVSTGNAGNLYIANSATATIEGGKILNGSANQGDNVYVDATATLNVKGGIIVGGVATATGATVKLAGAPKIVTSYTEGEVNYTAEDGLTLNGNLANVDELTADAEIFVNTNFGVPFTAAYTGSVDLTQVFATNLTKYILQKNAENQYVYIKDPALWPNANMTESEKAAFVKAMSAEIKSDFEGKTGTVEAICPVCYLDGKEDKVTWTPIAKNTAMTVGNHYYVAADITDSTSTGTYIFGAGCLNLNGKNITLTGGCRFLSVDKGGNTNIMDTAGTSVIKGSYDKDVVTNNFATTLRAANNSAVVNLFGGTYERIADTETAQDNPVAVVGVRWGTINMYDGATIQNGDSTQSGGNGGNVYVNTGTTFNMYGGTIQGGKAANRGGNIYVDKTATLNVKGGAILNGTGAYGGNIYVLDNGILNISGGFIAGGVGTTDAYGANVYVRNNQGTLSLTGGTIVGGVSGGSTANTNITMSGAPKVIPSAVYNGVPYTATRGLEKCPVNTTNLTEGADLWTGDTMSQSVAWCPTCQAFKTWTTISEPQAMVAGNHYRLKNDINKEIDNFLTGAGCIDLNGKNVTITGGNFVSAADSATINVVDTVGGGKVVDATHPANQ